MTDKHVDDLLGDLDRALGVEVSASVAARVRTNRASATRSHRLGWFVAAAAVAGMFVGAVYLMQPSPTVEPQIVATAVPPRAPEPTEFGPRVSALGPRVSAPARAERRVLNAEPRVSRPEGRGPNAEFDDRPLVAADTRLALRQVAATLRGSGAIETPAVEIPREPLTLALSTMVIETFAVEPTPPLESVNAGAASTQ